MTTTDRFDEITLLRQRLHMLSQFIVEMEDLLERYTTAEESLRHSEEHFRLLVSGVRDYAIFMLDTKGYVASWNTGAQLIKGYTATEIIGQHFSIFYLPEEVAAGKPAHKLELAERDGVYREEGWRVRKDGSLFWASVVITALYDESGTLRGFGKVTRDLTERKLAEEVQQQVRERELQLARAEAARAEAEANVRLRDTFLSSTAHELRTPVTSVLGYALLLQRRLDRGEFTLDRIQKPLHAITDQAQRLERLTSMLLDITRLEHGKLVLELRPIDLCESIAQVVQELQLLTEQHTITVELPSSPIIVSGDDLRIEQAIYNLIQNAIKYSPAGGTITVTAQQDAQQAVITVTDEGVGIPAEDLPYVFDRFYRATNISQGNISGIGLGLYLVKEFVGLHSGTVDIQSVVGQGTTFRVTLPSAG